MPLVLVLPDLAFIVLAALLLLLAWSLRGLLAPLINAIIRPIFAIGDTLADGLLSLLDGLVNAAESALAAGVKVITDLVDLATGAAQWLLGLGADAIDAVAGFAREATGNLFGLVAAAQSDIGDLVAGAAAGLVQLGKLADKLAGAVGDIAHLIASTIPNAIHDAVVAVQHFAQGLVNDASTALHKVIDATTATLRGLISDAVTTAEHLVGDLRDDVQSSLQDLQKTLQADLAAAIAVVTTEVGTLTHSLDGLLTLLRPFAIPAVVAATVEMVTEWPATKRECIDPTCSFLSPLLSELSDGIILAGIAGMVAYAIEDPEGAAHAMIGLSEPFISGGRELFHELAGVTL